MSARPTTPLWARCYLGFKDGFERWVPNPAGVCVVGLVAWLTVAYAGVALTVGRAYPSLWRTYAPVGFALATVLFGMTPVAALRLADSSAERYRGGWP